MFNYYLIYNNTTNLDVRTRIAARPSKPSPQKRIQTITVPHGKTLYIEDGYEDISITVEFNFISREPYLWDKDWRDIKRWLLGKGDRKLKFSDDLEGYYIINNIEIDTPERIIRRGGKVQVTFICEPYFYYDCDEMEITSGQVIYNDYETSLPMYRITGQGEINLTVNGKPIKVNIGTETKIDCDKGLTYRDNVRNNTSLTGVYSDLYLQPGENTISWTGTGFRVFIIPNWRSV